MLAGALAVGMISAWQATAVQVQGDTSCPSPGAVGAELVRIAGPGARGDGAGPVDLAALVSDGALVRLRLRRAADGAIEERALPELGSCGERATAAAVILAAWEARLDPPEIAALPSPPGSASGGNGNAGTAPPSIRAGATSLPSAALGVSMAALLSMRVGVAPALAAEVSFARPGRPLGVAAGILLVNSHDINLVTGPASWRRAGLTSDVRWRYASARVWAEGRAGLALTLIQISTLSGNSNWLDPGATAGIRAGLMTRAPMPWLQISGAFWPRAQILYGVYAGSAVLSVPGSSGPTVDERNLPHFELFAGLGVSFGRGR